MYVCLCVQKDTEHTRSFIVWSHIKQYMYVYEMNKINFQYNAFNNVYNYVYMDMCAFVYVYVVQKTKTIKLENANLLNYLLYLPTKLLFAHLYLVLFSYFYFAYFTIIFLLPIVLTR